MSAAATNLTPVTLELGGKNPCIVAPDYDLVVAAQTVAAAKTENSGQVMEAQAEQFHEVCEYVQVCTCVDTIFVPPGKAESFAGFMRENLKARWGNEELGKHEQYCNLIHDRHFDRCQQMLHDAEAKATVVSLDPTGCRKYENAGRRIPPHAIINPPADALCSQEEIFGPLCVIREMSLENAVDYINTHDCPLACYVFTNNNETKQALQKQIRCGGMGINCVNLHTVVGALPFGGMGASGTGCYHGKEGFLNFSHRMSCYDFKRKVLPNIHLPYTDKDVSTIEAYCKPPPNVSLILRVVGVAVVSAVVTQVEWRSALIGLAQWVIRTLE